jgi:hypothetical protein
MGSFWGYGEGFQRAGKCGEEAGSIWTVERRTTGLSRLLGYTRLVIAWKVQLLSALIQLIWFIALFPVNWDIEDSTLALSSTAQSTPRDTVS